MKRFQGFRVDTTNHCLWRGDERVSVIPKAFDLLRYLVDHADRLVTQDEILEAFTDLALAVSFAREGGSTGGAAP
jgi:DNA-binding winged helix-turn-helix (wHTH) protein